MSSYITKDKVNRAIKICFCFLLFSVGVFAQADDKEHFWIQLKIDSQNAVFRINNPDDACISIIAAIAGKRQSDILWGPQFLKKGTYSLTLPASRVAYQKGFVERFNLEISPTLITGSRGSGERQFNNPMGIDYDRTQRELYVADTGNHRIVRLAHSGRFLSHHGGFGLVFRGQQGKKEDSLDNPFDVAIGGFSNFYVSDQNNHRVATFDAYKNHKGNLFPLHNDRRNRLERPMGIRVDSENNIWVVDNRADKILKLSSSGEKLLELGGFGYSTLQLKDPTQVDTNSRGEIFIADRGNNRIAIFDRLGSFIYEIKQNITPSAITIDPDGLLVITDGKENKLYLFTPSGTKIMQISTAHDGSNFRQPSDVAISDDSVFLLDSGNHRIIHFDRKKVSSKILWGEETNE